MNMPKIKLKFSSILIITIVLTLGLSISLQSLLAQWAPPTASPPSNNIANLIYADSAVDQIITGGGGFGIAGPLSANQAAISGDGTGQASIGGGFCGGDYTGISLNGLLGCGNYNILSNPNDQNLYINRPTGHEIRFKENNSDQVVIQSGGNVGIGTTSPQGKLDVNGTIVSSGEVEYNLFSDDLALYALGNHYDALAYQLINACEYYDGAAWQNGANMCEPLLDDNAFTRVNLDNTQQGVRLTFFLISEWSELYYLTLYEEYVADPGNNVDLQIIVETSPDNSVWTQQYSGMATNYGWFRAYAFKPASGDDYFRITLNAPTLAAGETKSLVNLHYYGTRKYQTYDNKPFYTDYDRNVGIGITNPDNRLHVFDAIKLSHNASQPYLNFQSGIDTHYGYIEFRKSTGSTRGAYIGYGTPGSYVDFALEDGNDLAITGGNVGIGTNAPGGKFSVYSSTHAGDQSDGITLHNSNGTVNSYIYHNSNSDLIIRKSSISNQLVLDVGGNVGIGMDVPAYTLDVAGDISASGAYYGGSCDIAERYDAVEEEKNKLEPGDILSIDEEQELKIKKSDKAYDNMVIGVYSTRPLMVMGTTKESNDRNNPPVALLGRVPTKVTDENGLINIGDNIVSSSRPGYGMRCDDYEKCRGAILGKALQKMEDNEGVIEVLLKTGY